MPQSGRDTLTPEDFVAAIRRHIGHQLRCVESTAKVYPFLIETCVLRCEDCGEVVLEAEKRHFKPRRRKHAGP